MSLRSGADSDLFNFSGSVGRNGENDRTDVIKAQMLLANAGALELPEPGVPTGWAGESLHRAIGRFQRDTGLPTDGLLLPLRDGTVGENGEGETLHALKGLLGDRISGLQIPSQQQVDSFYDAYARNPDVVSGFRTMEKRGDEPDPPFRLLPADGRDAPPIMLRSGVADEQAEGPGKVKPGQQEAFLMPAVQGAIRVAPQIPNLLRGLGILAPTIAIPLDGDTPGGDRAQAPEAEPMLSPPQQEAEVIPQPQRGRIVIAEDGKELHVPPLGAWADKLSPEERTLAHSLADAFTVEMARAGSRGDAWTQKGVDIYIQECLDVARQDLPQLGLDHVAGGTKDGKATGIKAGEKREEYLTNVIEGLRSRSGSGRPDITFEFSRDIVERLRINTMSKRADGVTNTANEQRRVDNLRRLTKGEAVAEFAKFPKGMSEDEMHDRAREACREALGDWMRDLRKRGELDKPPPKEKKTYGGHSILRELRP